MEVTRGQPEFYFDTQTGQLLIGRLAVGAHLESGAHAADLQPLHEVLLNEDEEIPAGAYDRINANDWQVEDYKIYAKWLLGYARTYNPEQTLNRPLLIRASSLGIGPAYKRVMRSGGFGSLANLARSIGEKPNYRRREYDNLPMDYFADYVESVFLNKKLDVWLEDALYEKARNDEGPSPDIIRRVAGGLRTLLERRGYVDTPRWEADDYIMWGVRFMIANQGRVIKTPHLQLLSARRRGPSTFAIETNFGGVLSYSWQVEIAYGEHLKAEEQNQADKLAYLEKLQRHEDEAVCQLFLSANDSVRLRRGALFRVSEELLPSITIRQRVRLAKASQSNFIKAVREYDETVTAADIEIAAISLGVFNDIWPTDDYLETLKVA